MLGKMKPGQTRTFSSSFFSSAFSSAAAAAGAPPPDEAATAPPEGTYGVPAYQYPSPVHMHADITHGSELGRTLSNEGVDVLALELRDELLEALLVGLNADGAQDLLDVRRGGGGVAADLEEEVRSEMTHLEESERGMVGPECAR